MAADFRFIVIGRGMMGAAAARHLAGQRDGVAVIGPDEPEDYRAHQGVFASHYDEGRITRTIDPDADWARLANRSIARYRDIEEQSGIDFYSPVGCLVVGPKRGDYIANVIAAADALKVKADVLDDTALKAAFPFFAFAGENEGVHEAEGAGYISPRRLVKAQSALAAKAGAKVLKETVSSIREEGGLAVVTTVEGNRYTAEKALMATGGFSISNRLLEAPVDLKVRGRTIALFEISEADARAFAAMPSLIRKGHVETESIYLLPPIRYPDGKFYIKIGGDPDDLELTTGEELKDWFRSDGRPAVKEHLTRIIHQLVPDLRPLSVSSHSCVTSFSPTDYPMIAYTSSQHIAIMTGCSGTSAKSSDEIGRLGAELLLEGRIKDGVYATDFAAHFLK